MVSFIKLDLIIILSSIICFQMQFTNYFLNLFLKTEAILGITNPNGLFNSLGIAITEISVVKLKMSGFCITQ